MADSFLRSASPKRCPSCRFVKPYLLGELCPDCQVKRLAALVEQLEAKVLELEHDSKCLNQGLDDAIGFISDKGHLGEFLCLNAPEEFPCLGAPEPQ